ncbi:MAG: tRNA (guanosine(37)-N1)-methyltransferase TrmD [Gammaproteobacteria bacterium]|jgi:tRNA (guanine37-N1)-methyltransferase
MLHIAVVTLFPEMFKIVQDYGVTGRAVKNSQVMVSTYNPRDYVEDVHRTVDDRPYGGGPGMVMMVKPLQEAIRTAKQSLINGKVIYLSPQGTRLEQKSVSKLVEYQELILISGRYEGVDQRLIDNEVDEEWSIGDYVLSGGELPAMVLIDAMTRIIPGVLGDNESANQDSFMNGLLESPHYTRPEEINGNRVPQILLSGDHEKIRLWRLKQSLGTTWEKRPDLLSDMKLDDEQKRLMAEYKNELQS